MLEVPSLREELDRKTGEALDWLITSYSIGRLDAAQFDAGISTLWMTVAGIADKDFAHVISEASKEIRSAAVHKHSFHHPSKAVIKQIVWTVGEDSISLVERICGAFSSSKVVDCDDAATARDKMAKFEEVMLKQGWIEL